MTDNALFDIYCGDAREALPFIEGRAACVVTDPPYRLVSGGNKTGEMGGKFAKENYDNSGEIVQCNITWLEIMDVCFRALRERGHAYVMANDKNVFQAHMAAAAAGFRFHNLLTWHKCTATPNRFYMKNCEYILLIYKGAAKSINDCGSKQLVTIPQKDETDHPTEKPVPLMRHYIENSSQPGDLIVDPFMGSGTTGVAALQAGRLFAGVEIEPRYCKIANERLTAARNFPMFDFIGG